MANEIRLRSNNISGSITDNPLAIGATTINSPGFADLPTVDATNHLILILDPLEVGGTAEIVRVTAHTAAATSVTVQRGQESSVARSHVFNTTWFHGPVASDFSAYPDPPRAMAIRVASQNAANNAWTLLSFDVESVDTMNMFSLGAPDRFTIVVPGRYQLTMSANISTSVVGGRGFAICRGVAGGINFLGYSLILPGVAPFETNQTVSAEAVFTAGETVSFQVFQNSGGVLTTGGNGNAQAFGAVRWVASS